MCVTDTHYSIILSISNNILIPMITTMSTKYCVRVAQHLWLPICEEVYTDLLIALLVEQHVCVEQLHQQLHLHLLLHALLGDAARLLETLQHPLGVFALMGGGERGKGKEGGREGGKGKEGGREGGKGKEGGREGGREGRGRREGGREGRGRREGERAGS